MEAGSRGGVFDPREQREFLSTLQSSLGSTASFRLLYNGGSAGGGGEDGGKSGSGGLVQTLGKVLNESLAALLAPREEKEERGGGVTPSTGTTTVTQKKQEQRASAASIAQLPSTSGLSAGELNVVTALFNTFFTPASADAAAAGAGGGVPAGAAEANAAEDDKAAAICVSLLLAVYDEFDVGASWTELDVCCAAAGIFVSERFAAASSLRVLLSAAIKAEVASGGSSSGAGDGGGATTMDGIERNDGGFEAALVRGASGLLQAKGARNERVVASLIAYAKSAMHIPGSGGGGGSAGGGGGDNWGWSARGEVKFAIVESGNEPLSLLQTREITAVCECLVLAVPMMTTVGGGGGGGGDTLIGSNSSSGSSDRIATAIGDAVSLAEMLSALETRAKHASEVACQQTYLVAIALVASFFTPAGASKERFTSTISNDASLKALIVGDTNAPPTLSSSTAIQSLMHRTGSADTNARTDVRAFVQLAYSVLVSGDATMMASAIAKGALEYPLRAIFDSTSFDDEEAAVRLVIVHVIHDLMMAFLNLRTGRELVQKMQAGVDPGAPAAKHGDIALPSHALPHLLETLSAIYNAFPDLCSASTSNADMFAPFVEHVLEFSTASAAIMIPFLHLLRAMSKSEHGKLIVLDVMKGDLRAASVNWDLLFRTLSEYCVRYSMPTNDELEDDTQPFASPVVQIDMSPDDADGLTAFLGLLETVWEESLGSEVEQWVTRLRERPDYGYHPLEPLFQLVMHPVPLQLKAALIKTIKAYVHSTDSAKYVWEKLDQCGFVGAPRVSSLSSGAYLGNGDVRRNEANNDFVMDSGFELRESEARSEQYPRTMAFVSLLNKLARKTENIDGGNHPYAKYSAFVRDQVFYPFASRGYKDEREKWEIASLCMEHFYLVVSSIYKRLSGGSGSAWVTGSGDDLVGVLRSLSGVPTKSHAGGNPAAAAVNGGGRPLFGVAGGTDFGGGSGGTNGISSVKYGDATGEALESVSPGLLVMADFMQDGKIRHTVLSILQQGVSTLCELRSSTKHGAEAEQAVIMAVRLLHLVLKCDQVIFETVPEEQSVIQRVDNAFVKDRRHLVTIFEYIRYPYNPMVQHAVLELLEILLPRLDDPLDLLLQSGQSSSVARIVKGMNSCLRQGFFNDSGEHSFLRSVEETADEMSDLKTETFQRGDRSELLLQILLASAARSPSPGLIHMAMGYAVDYGIEGVLQSHLDGRRRETCLRPIIEALTSDIVFESSPGLYDLCMRVVYVLASDPASGPPMLDLLHRDFLPAFLDRILPKVMYIPLADFDERNRATATFIAAHTVQLMALILHSADADVPLHYENMTLILRSVYGIHGPGYQGHGDGPLIRSALDNACYDIQLPSDAALPEDVRRWKQCLLDERINRMIPEMTYASPLGNFNLVDTQALSGAVLSASQDVIATSRIAVPSADHHALKEAARHIVRIALQKNAFAHGDAAQLALISGWRALVIVSCTTRFEMVVRDKSLADGGVILSDLLDASLTRLLSLPPSRAEVLSPHLCQVVATLLAKLREILTPAGLCTSAVHLPKTARSILSKLLLVILAPERTGKTRQLLYAGLLSLLHLCSFPLELDFPLDVLSIVVSNHPHGMGNAARMISSRDGLSSATEQTLFDSQRALKTALEQTIVKAIGPLIEVITRDASEGSQATRTLAFHVVAALVHSGTTMSRRKILNAAEGSDFVGLCLEEVRRSGNTSIDSNLQFSSLVLNAALVVLLNMCTSDPERIEGLVRADMLSAIMACQAFSANGSDLPQAAMSQSEHKRNISLPILRILCTVATVLPRSIEVTGHMMDFLEYHRRLIHRVFTDQSQHHQVSHEGLQQLCLFVGLVSQVMAAERVNEMVTGAAKEHTSSYLGLHPLLNDLMWRNFTNDELSQGSYMKQIEANRHAMHGGESIDVLTMHTSLNELQANLVRHLRISTESSHGEQPSPLPILSSQSSRDGLPSLQLLAELVDASSADLEATWETHASLLMKLRSVSQGLTLGLDEEGVSGSLPANVVRMGNHAGILERKEKLLVFIIENCLEVIHRGVKDAASDDGATRADDTDAMMGDRRQVLMTSSPFTPLTRSSSLVAASKGSQEIARFAKRLKPLLDRLMSANFVDQDRKCIEYSQLLSRNILRLLPEFI